MVDGEKSKCKDKVDRSPGPTAHLYGCRIFLFQQFTPCPMRDTRFLHLFMVFSVPHGERLYS